MDYALSPHAEQELTRRNIPRQKLEDLLAHPQQIVPGYGGRLLLLRAVVDQTLTPAVVVTVYRTSKIAKYWQQS